MWQHFASYKEWVTENPIKKHVFVGKDGHTAWEERDRPLTYEGFCNYLANNEIITTVDHYFMNYENRYEDFVGVCLRIKREIRAEQIEKGLAGIYNPSITQRLNGLAEKTDSRLVDAEGNDRSFEITLNLK